MYMVYYAEISYYTDNKDKFFHFDRHKLLW